MTIDFSWQLPTVADAVYGDARPRQRGERHSDAHPYSLAVTDPRGRRFNYFDYLIQVARAAEQAGFDAIRIPEDEHGEEPWIVAGVVGREARKLRLITEFHASRGSAVYAAKNAASFQRFTGGRFAWQISSGGNDPQRRRLGDFVAQANVLPRIEEFITVARGVLTETDYTYKGDFFEVLHGGFSGSLAGLNVPRIYLSGSDEAAQRLSAKHADVHIFEAAALGLIERDIARLRGLATREGRSLQFGLRIDLVARETEQEALFDARRFHRQSSEPHDVTDGQSGHRLWSGLSTHLTGATATLVGSYDQVAEALIDFGRSGVEHFLLSSVPHFEEAYRIGEHVLPRVRAALSSAGRYVA